MCDALVYIQAYVVPVICGPLTQQPTELAQSSCIHLHGLSVADSCGRGDLPISILNGADYYWSMVEGTVVTSAPWEPVALATKLGYVLSGPTMIMSHDDNGNTVNLTATHVLKVEASVVNQEEIASELGKFWDYESLGFEMTTCLCMTNLLTKSNLWREDIKYSYPSRKTMSCFQIILHCASQGWFHC